MREATHIRTGESPRLTILQQEQVLSRRTESYSNAVTTPIFLFLTFELRSCDDTVSQDCAGVADVPLSGQAG